MDAPEFELKTEHLDLVATQLEHIVCELESPSDLGRLLGALIPSGWPPGEYDRGAMEFFRARYEQGGRSAIGWYGWYAIRRADDEAPRTLVAAAGYMGPPDAEGTVEIGYSVTPEWRSHGYASEIVRALVARAGHAGAVKRVIAHAANDNPASRRVLERAGFTWAGSGSEPGTVRYERAPDEGSGPGTGP